MFISGKISFWIGLAFTLRHHRRIVSVKFWKCFSSGNFSIRSLKNDALASCKHFIRILSKTMPSVARTTVKWQWWAQKNQYSCVMSLVSLSNFSFKLLFPLPFIFSRLEHWKWKAKRVDNVDQVLSFWRNGYVHLWVGCSQLLRSLTPQTPWVR